MYEIFENLNIMNETPVYSEHKSWFKKVRLRHNLIKIRYLIAPGFVMSRIKYNREQTKIEF